MAGAIEHSDAPQVTCPYKDENYSCDMTLLDREIKAVSIFHYEIFFTATSFIIRSLEMTNTPKVCKEYLPNLIVVPNFCLLR